MCAIGWFLGENLDRAMRVASGIGYAGLAILLLFLAAIWYGGRRYRRGRTLRRQAGDRQAGE